MLCGCSFAPPFPAAAAGGTRAPGAGSTSGTGERAGAGAGRAGGGGGRLSGEEPLGAGPVAVMGLQPLMVAPGGFEPQLRSPWLPGGEAAGAGRGPAARLDPSSALLPPEPL